MKTTLLLTKIFFKNSLNSKKNEKKSKNKIGTIILAIFLLAYFGGIFGFLSYEMINMLKTINQETLFLGFMAIMMLVLIIMQTVFTSINLLYFSKDLEFVLPMPVNQTQVLMAKFLNIVISEYIIELLFMLSPLIVYGILTQAGILFYIYMILVLLIFPIVPIAIVCTLIMCIMAFSKLIKNKDRLQLLATVFTIILVIILQGFAYQNEEITDEQMLEQMLQKNGAVTMISEIFVTIKYSVNILSNSDTIIGLFELIKLICVTGITVLIFKEIGHKIYYRGVINSLAGGGSNSKNKKISNKIYKQNNVSKSYVGKELKNLKRNSVFFMQCILPQIIFPIFLLIPFFSGGEELMVELAKENMQILTFLYTPLGFSIVLCLLQLMFMMSFTALTAVSRDGQNAIFMKYIPVSLHKQFIYKIIPNILISTIPIIIIMIALKLFILKEISIIYLILIFIISTLLNIIQSYCMLLIDLKRPKLEWATEYAVVKQNFNMIYEIIYAFIIMTIIGVVGYLTREMNFMYVVTGITIVLSIIFIALDKFVQKNQKKLFEKII